MKNCITLLLFILFAVVLFSCDDFDDTPPITNPTDSTYFETYESITSYSLTDMNTLLTLASSLYPELKELIEPIEEELASDVQLIRINYNTTFDGNNVVASGLVSIPKTSGTYPIMSFQNGTNTLHSDAPSVSDYTLLSEDNMSLKLLAMMASTGFVVAIPDYLGFGESDDMFHPYLHKTSTVQSVLDMLRAVKEMLNEQKAISNLQEVTVNDDLYITGYSQGGWATSAIQEAINTIYSDEFTLKASASGGGPHNLVAFADSVFSEETYDQPYFLAYLFNSYEKLGMTTPIDSIFQEPYAAKISSLFDGTKSGGEINEALTTNISELLTANFIANWNKGGVYESLYTMLEANSNHGYATTTPTQLMHGTADTYVLPSLSENLYQEFVDSNVSDDLISLNLLDGLDHTGAVIPAELTAIKWFIELKDSEN